MLGEWRGGLAAVVLSASGACSGVIGDADPGTTDGHGSVPGVAGDPTALPETAGAIDPVIDLPTDPNAIAVAHPAPTLRRLTLPQYRNTVRDLLGTDPGVEGLTPVPPLNGLGAVGTSSIALGERDLERFGEIAEASATAVFADTAARAALTACDAAEASCPLAFVRAFGRRAFRRPLTTAEEDKYVALAALALKGTADPWIALSVVTRAFLQSPYFLYRVELGEPDPMDSTRRRLDAYELASRLSYFVWDTTPDDELLDAAVQGVLDTVSGVTSQAERLLASPRAASAIETFFRDYLRLDALDTLDKIPEQFPQLTDTLGPAMASETVAMLRTLVFERGEDLRQVLTTRTAFVSDELARLYGIAEPGGDALVEVELPADGPRAGLLMQASFLASHAHPSRSSPTLRGKFVRESLLCQGIQPPPPDVDTTLPDTSSAPTMREKLEIHRQNPTCAACHSLMDPIGLALENFDAIGAYRARDNGIRIDASGELDGVTFPDALGLAEAVADHPDFVECFARTLLRSARGQIEDESEDALIENFASEFAASGHGVPALMLRIMTSETFRHTGGLP